MFSLFGRWCSETCIFQLLWPGVQMFNIQTWHWVLVSQNQYPYCWVQPDSTFLLLSQSGHMISNLWSDQCHCKIIITIVCTKNKNRTMSVRRNRTMTRLTPPLHEEGQSRGWCHPMHILFTATFCWLLTFVTLSSIWNPVTWCLLSDHILYSHIPFTTNIHA